MNVEVMTYTMHYDNYDDWFYYNVSDAYDME